MKTFTSALLAVSAYARYGSTSYGGGSGLNVVNQAYGNASFGSTRGYNFGAGNGALHGDGHGHTVNRIGYGSGSSGYGSVEKSSDYFSYSSQDHMWGYDSVPEIETSDYDTELATNNNAVLADLQTKIDAENVARQEYIDTLYEARIRRFQDIQDDELTKVMAPFNYQIDLLDEEIEDIQQAKAYALADAQEAYDDLVGETNPYGRMTKYRDDKITALEREADNVVRAIMRAQDDRKHVDEVLYAMSLDWLQGISVVGLTADYDKRIWNGELAFGGFFDKFTFDIGHGKPQGGSSYGKQEASRPAPPQPRYKKRPAPPAYSAPAPKYEAPEPTYEEPVQEEPKYTAPAPKRRTTRRRRRTSRYGARRPSYGGRRGGARRRPSYRRPAPQRRAYY